MSKKRNRHTEEFKREAVRLMLSRGERTVGDVAKSVGVNIEADSINSALLAPDAAGGGAAFDAFVREVVREMTVKAGQKCTAIRRIFVPAERADAVTGALAAKLKGTTTGAWGPW